METATQQATDRTNNPGAAKDFPTHTFLLSFLHPIAAPLNVHPFTTSDAGVLKAEIRLMSRDLKAPSYPAPAPSHAYSWVDRDETLTHDDYFFLGKALLLICGSALLIILIGGMFL
jgi:hypothetical protein